MRVIGIIQARMASTRLPAKILRPLAGRPLLEVLVQRLASAWVEEWWLATTQDQDDDLTADWGTALGLYVYRGAVDDVLSRFTDIVADRSPDWIVRVTADDPFMDGSMINVMLDSLSDGEDVDLLGPNPTSGFPLGYVPELARASAVLELEHLIPADQPYHRAHVLSWLYQAARFRPFPLPDGWPARPDWRWTIDYPDDLLMARQAFELLGEHFQTATYGDIVQVLDRHPEVPILNSGFVQKNLEEG